MTRRRGRELLYGMHWRKRERLVESFLWGHSIAEIAHTRGLAREIVEECLRWYADRLEARRGG